MKWFIPSKTFLLGEYAALAQKSAILITTTPYFELSLTQTQGMVGIHPDSPAGIWWQGEQNSAQGLSFSDPYQGQGGLGASSAQFLGSFLAHCKLLHQIPNLNSMLEAYYQCSWAQKGLKPSGYDLIAQSQSGCVYINKTNQKIQSYDWPFKELSLFIVHTGRKLATHQHLQTTTLPRQINQLSSIGDQAKSAFEHKNSQQLIQAVNQYHQELKQLDFIAPHSLELINQLQSLPEILAIKGCGALGADTLLLLTAQEQAPILQKKLAAQRLRILATEQQITPTNTPSLIRDKSVCLFKK